MATTTATPVTPISVTGWTVIQRMKTVGTTVSWDQNWAMYKTGFGMMADNYWLGNDNIHAMTTTGDYKLRVEVSS